MLQKPEKTISRYFLYCSNTHGEIRAFLLKVSLFSLSYRRKETRFCKYGTGSFSQILATKLLPGQFLWLAHTVYTTKKPPELIFLSRWVCVFFSDSRKLCYFLGCNVIYTHLFFRKSMAFCKEPSYRSWIHKILWVSTVTTPPNVLGLVPKSLQYNPSNISLYRSLFCRWSISFLRFLHSLFIQIRLCQPTIFPVFFQRFFECPIFVVLLLLTNLFSSILILGYQNQKSRFVINEILRFRVFCAALPN